MPPLFPHCRLSFTCAHVRLNYFSSTFQRTNNIFSHNKSSISISQNLEKRTGPAPLSPPLLLLAPGSLPDSVALPSDRGTRQSPICTRQRLCRVLHSAKKESAKTSLPSVFCRALGKAFAECRHSAKLEPKKNPKKMEIFTKKNRIFF